jgi:hypothetical protein
MGVPMSPEQEAWFQSVLDMLAKESPLSKLVFGGSSGREFIGCVRALESENQALRVRNEELREALRKAAYEWESGQLDALERGTNACFIARAALAHPTGDSEP